MSHDEELREFMLVIRRALLMVVRWIEKRYAYDTREDALTET